MKAVYFLLIFVIAVLFFVFVIARVAFSKPASAESRLRDWMERHGFEAIETEKRLFFRGPFTFDRFPGTVFRIVVKTADGEIKVGWLSLHSGFFWREFEEVRWKR